MLKNVALFCVTQGDRRQIKGNTQPFQLTTLIHDLYSVYYIVGHVEGFQQPLDAQLLEYSRYTSL